MNESIIKEISKDLKIEEKQVAKTLELLSEDNTIPFIARYRKDVTGNLNEEQIRSINEVYMYQVNLLKKKEDVIRLIDEKGLLTDDIKNKILECNKLIDVEDIYRPYKEKKKTKATEAIKNGLEPLAKMILSFPTTGNIEQLTSKFINENVKNKDDAITNACYIIAEYTSDNAFFRKWIRNYTFNNGTIVSKKKKNDLDKELLYEMYYDYSEKIKYIKLHRVLAFNRAEEQNVVSVSIDIDENVILEFLENKIIKNNNSFVVDYVKNAIKDSYKRLIKPSIEREIRSYLTESAEILAIDNFGKNLEALLLTPPMKDIKVLAFDPGYINGCKIAVIDATGKYLDSTVIKPFIKSSKQDEVIKQCKLIIKSLIEKYNVDIIAIGNGTASRESEKFVSEMIHEFNLKCKYVIVSEAGASIYSASKLAIEEFPDLEVEKRSAVSIGRRLQDPLSELVKIPPDGIGVGLYQHDVSQTKLKDNLDFVVSKTVNSVGVNINTASSSLLKYISGLTKKNIDKIIDTRDKLGKIKSREDVKKLLSDKVYQQAIGFIRVPNSSNLLDSTSIHPESYDIAKKILNKYDLTMNDIGTEKLNNSLDSVNINICSKELGTDIYTLQDVIDCLKKPNRDPRDVYPQPILKSDVLNIDDLNVGMQLQGTVRNVVDFGAFIDIGLHNDALVHISKITNRFIKHPSEILKVGDIITCYVDAINKEKGKVNLTLIKGE